ncbi:hypothetical protein ACQE3E_17810 [Methylomonas sp. MED-D]|uniref:hypothetical protein n=1 Tax=Methylomonas sp. MED-D TaxID=3418768 RepID=UPI003D083ECA
MIELTVPVSIQSKIALKIADNHQLYQHEFQNQNQNQNQKLKANSWNSVDHCAFNCGHPDGRSSIHTGTGAFLTKCCHKKGINFLEFLQEKYKLSIQEAINKFSERLGISVLDMPARIRGGCH